MAGKGQIKKKVIADPGLKSELAKEPVEKIESSDVKSEYQNHPKFDKFKKTEEQ